MLGTNVTCGTGRAGPWSTLGRAGLALLLLAAAVAQAQGAPAVEAVSPFDMAGLLQAATLGGAGPLDGGTLTVNDQVVTIPGNLLVQMPSTFVTWPELFRLAPPPYGPSQTGLALADSPAPIAAYQVLVQGNRVGDQYVAGLVSISQVLLASGQGFITHLDYSRGELRVGGTLGSPTTGQRVRLNDPLGRYGPAWSPDVRFTVNEDNPTVRSATGFPMCVPRSDPGTAPDPQCPQTNRPVSPTTGAYLTTFTMPDRSGQGPVLSSSPDATRQTPFELGDFVTYSGILIQDGAQPTAGPAVATGTTLVAAYSVIANVGIYTFPGSDPAYVAIDVAILGVGGTPIAGVPQEATARTRFEGFSTDPSRVVRLFGVDADPCTGATSDRDWGAIAVDPGPPVGAVLGRWRFRPPGKVLALPAAGAFLPATRTVRATLGAPMTVANGLTAGTYQAPIADFLFPENLAVGGAPVPHNFQEFPFLSGGSGPWPGAGTRPVYAGVVGQLSPWPGQPAPPVMACAPAAPQLPVASAGSAQSIVSGAPVTLDGSGSVDPNGLAMTYAWTQTAGPSVALSSTTVMRPTFTAPAVAATQALAFQLVVADSSGTSAPSTVTVTVLPAAAAALPPIASAGPPQTVASNATVQLDGSGSADGNTPPLALAWAWTQVAGPAVTLAGATSARPTFTAPVAPPGAPALLTFRLTVTSSAGLTAASEVNVTVNPVTAPFADAGGALKTPAQTVLPSTSVTIDGSGSYDPSGLPLTYAWTQTSGPAVALVTTSTSPRATFTAPPVAPATLVFQLVVSNGYLSSAPSSVTISVQNRDQVVIRSAIYRTSQQRLTVTAISTGNADLWLKGLNGGPDIPMPIQFPNGIPTVDLFGVANPGSVTVVSSLGGSASRVVTQRN